MGQSVGYQLRWGLQLGSGVGLLMAGIGACVVPMVEYSPQHLNLDRDGVHAAATVTHKDMVRGYQSLPNMRGVGGVAGSAAAGYRLGRALEAQQSGKPIQGPQDSFAIEYSFKPASGQALFGVQGVSRDTYDGLRVGSKIEVVYHPTNPSIHRLPEYTVPFENSSLLQRILIAIVGFLLGGFTLYRGIRNAMGGKSDEKVDPVLERLSPPAARAPFKAPAWSTSSSAPIEPRGRPTRAPQFGSRVRT